MKTRILEFDAREGGAFRMALDYLSTDHAMPGKTSEHTDGVQGRFRRLVPDERVVEEIVFESSDPQFAGTMTLTTALEAVPGGTMVTILIENAPSGIRPEDHEVGIASTLGNLAAFVE